MRNDELLFLANNFKMLKMKLVTVLCTVLFPILFTSCNEAKMKPKITSFKFKKFKSELSRDSNSHYEIFELKDGVYSVSEERKGYHPRGGHFNLPSSDYFMTDLALNKIVEYIEKNELNKDQSYASFEDEAAPTNSLPPTPRDDVRRYGLNLTMKYESHQVEVKFVYETDGPKDPRFEEMTLSQKLNGLYELLSSIHYSEKLKSTKQAK